MTTADRTCLKARLRDLIYAAEQRARDVENQETKAANVLYRGFYSVAQVWRELLAEVEDGE